MKKNVTIIVLAVCLVVTVIGTVVMGLSLNKLQEKAFETARLAERVWDDYISHCNIMGCDPNYEQPLDHEGSYAGEVIRCVYIEAFDESVPDDPLPENQLYGPSGGYVYDVYIYGDGSGYLHYQQWGSIYTIEIEEDGHRNLIDDRRVLFAESTTPLTAEEIDSIFAVMEQHDYGNIPTHNPAMYTGMDGNTTFLVYSSSLVDDHADWKGHMISAFYAEEGDPCYEIRKAIEKLVIAHDAGVLPERIQPTA